MEPLQLALLGGFEAQRASGRRLILPRAKPKALLAYLALHAGRLFTRDNLATLLWPESTEEEARHSLRQALFLLRKSVVDLVVEGDGVALDARLVSIDTQSFEQMIATGTPEALAEATTLYRGALLAGLRVHEPPFEEWLSGERERLRELALDALRRLLAHQRETGSTAGAIRTASRLVAADPLQESAHRALMELYVASGRPDRALRQYRVCRTALRDELAVDPEPETDRLYKGVLLRKTAAPASANVREVPLVGREVEVAALERLLDAAWAGQGQVTVIVGEAGVGKTRLVEEAGASARRRSGRVLVGRSYEMEQVLPFGPWFDTLRDAVSVLRIPDQIDPVWKRQLARLFPDLADAEPVDSAIAEGNIQVFEAVAHLLARLAREGPLVLILEDLHWADETSLRLLSFVAHRVHAERVLILATAREDELGESPALRRLLERFDREPRHARLYLAPLSRAATAALARSLSGNGSARRRLADIEQRVWEASEGNPFVAVEIVRELQEGRSPAPPAVPRLPARVSDMISGRLDRLDERTGALADVAAIVGRDFDSALLQRVTGFDAGVVALGVERLVRRHVLALRDDRLDFAHARIREVAANRLLPPRRVLIHAQVARAMEELHAGNLAAHSGRLAMHYVAGQVWDKALAYLSLAGRQAGFRGANQEAIACFEQALEALAHLPATPAAAEQGIDLRFDLRRVLSPLGHLDRALERLDEADRMASEIGDSRRLGWTSIHASGVRWTRGDLASSRDHARNALTIAERLRDESLTTAANNRLGLVCYSRGEYGEACQRFAEVVRCLDRDRRQDRLDPDCRITTIARSFLASALGERGLFEDGIAIGSEGLRLADAMFHPHDMVLARLGLAELYCVRGVVPPAIDLLEQALEVTRRYDLELVVFPVIRLLGYAHALGGRLPDGLVLLRKAMVMSESLGQRRPHASFCLVQLGRACLRDGRRQEAQELGERARDQCHGRDQRGFEAYALHLLGDVANHLGGAGADLAERRYHEALALATELDMQPLQARCHRSLGEIHRRAGRARRARKHLADAESMICRMRLEDWKS